jgi:ketosteroid isomerase-like protein
MKFELFTVLSLALGMIGCSRIADSPGVTDADIGELVKRTAEANAELVHGGIDRYIALTQHADDYTLMAPFGGTADHTALTLRARTGREWPASSSPGTLDQELVATYNSGDLVVLVTVERARAEIAELPEQDWSLRVTQVFRHDDTGWRLVHRHADPLVNSVSLEQAAALTRGDKH